MATLNDQTTTQDIRHDYEKLLALLICAMSVMMSLGLRVGVGGAGLLIKTPQAKRSKTKPCDSVLMR